MSAQTAKSSIADVLAAQLQRELNVGSSDDFSLTSTQSSVFHPATHAAKATGLKREDSGSTMLRRRDSVQAKHDSHDLNMALYLTTDGGANDILGDENEPPDVRRARKRAIERAKFLSPTENDLQQLRVSIAKRLEVNRGECIMEIGVTDDDGASLRFNQSEFATCLHTLQSAIKLLNADVTLLGDKTEDHTPAQTLETVLSSVASIHIDRSSLNKSTATLASSHSVGTRSGDAKNRMGFVLIRNKPEKVQDKLEVRVAVIGNVDAGKSTLLGVLTKNSLDNGRGKVRVALFRHKHEIETGRTSSVGMECMGFDSKGKQVGVTFNPHTDVTEIDLQQQSSILDNTENGKVTSSTKEHVHEKKITWEEIAQQSAKMITFIDLAGHERYLKTTTFGLCGAAPDFAMLMVGSNMGVIGMTKEHLGLSLALSVPVLIVVTKIDMCPTNVLEATIRQLMKILKSPGCRKIPMFVKTSEDVVRVATSFVSERICPIFLVSNVTGEGLPYLRKFLNILPLMNKYDVNSPVDYQITESFSVPGVGTVVSGVVMSGVVHQGDSLLLGPDSLGTFIPVTIKSIQRKRVNVPCASASQSASFALKKVKRAQIRKGMVLLSPNFDPPPIACRDFEAEVLVLYHSTTINTRYQAMLHCQNVRQTVKLVDMDRTILRTGDRALVRFTFLGHPEYMKPGSRILFREGRTKGIGKVTRVFPPGEAILAYVRLDTTNTLASDATSTSTPTPSSILLDHGTEQRSSHQISAITVKPKNTVTSISMSSISPGPLSASLHKSTVVPSPSSAYTTIAAKSTACDSVLMTPKQIRRKRRAA